MRGKFIVPVLASILFLSLLQPYQQASAQTCVAPPPGMISWWPLDETSGTISADIQDGNDGTHVNSPTPVPGKVAGALRFNGAGLPSGNAVVVGNPTNLQLQDFTIDAWIKRDDLTRAGAGGGFLEGEIFGYGSGGYIFGLFGDGRLFLSRTDVSHVAGGVPISDLNFHHVAVSKSGSTVIFYVDGVPSPPIPYNPGFTFTTDAAIGARGDLASDSTFLGTIDEVEVFNRALSQAEIQSIVNADSAGKCKIVDSDGDGVSDSTDNCPNTPNADQQDTNGDGIGDACQEDPTCDAVLCAGDILVPVSNTFGFSQPTLMKVDPVTGDRIVFSDLTNPSQGPTSLDLSGVAVGPNRIWAVAANFDQIVGKGVLFGIDPLTGNRVIVSDFADLLQGPTGQQPFRVIQESSGMILVSDPDAGTIVPGVGAAGVIFRIDPLTGARTILSDFGDPSQGPIGREPLNMAIDASGNIIITDLRAGIAGNGLIFSVDPVTGFRTIVSDFQTPSGFPAGRNPHGLAIGSSGNLIATTDKVAGIARELLINIDPLSGTRTIISDFVDASQGPLGSGADRSVAVESSGTHLVLDERSGTPQGTTFPMGTGQLFRVDPATGNRVVLSDFDDGLQGQRGINALDLSIVPFFDLDGDGFTTQVDCDDSDASINPGATDIPGDGIDQNCDGIDEPLPPGDLFCDDMTIDQLIASGAYNVIDNRDRHLGKNVKGTNGNDLILLSDLGDKANARQGDDCVIGGAGNDNIHGGKGNDQIFGQGGDDKISANQGNDYISGGDGDDKLWGGLGDDTIDAGDGDDKAHGNQGIDNITGGAGNDWLGAGIGDDVVSGGEGNDKIFGRPGADELNGDAGDDKIHGGQGPDAIDGGADYDLCHGGQGANTFDNCEDTKGQVAEEDDESEPEDDE